MTVQVLIVVEIHPKSFASQNNPIPKTRKPKIEILLPELLQNSIKNHHDN